jgi:arsenate reductase-like glutaredoxin family protein
MLEHNYHSYDVIEYLKDVPKYQEMLELLQTVKEKILSMHQASIEQDTTRLNVKLEKLSKY